MRYNLPVASYVLQTLTSTKQGTDKQRAIEQVVLGLSLEDRVLKGGHTG